MGDDSLIHRGLVDYRFLDDLPRERKPPAWVLSEPLICVGAWEPLFYRRRRGAATVNAEALFAYEHSEAFVQDVVALGANILITSFEKNHHIDDQEYALDQQLARHCRTHGLRLSTYIRADQIDSEHHADFLRDHDVRAERFDGSTPTYGRCDFRQHICFHKPGVLDLFKGSISRAVSDLRVDALHLDGFQVGGTETRDACRCPACRRDFTAFLQRRYGDDPQACRRRFGHTHLDAIAPPGTTAGPDIPRGHVTEPVWQEWIVFRCTWTARIAREVSEHVYRLNPDVGIFVNSSIPVRENGPLLMGLDLPSLGEGADVMMNEDAYGPQITTEGKILQRARQHKLGAASGCFIWNYMNAATERATYVQMAHAAAFNRGRLTVMGFGPGCYGSSGLRLHAGAKQGVLPWLRDHWEHFQGLEPVADVAVWREPRAMAFADPIAYATAMRVEQLLVEDRVAFSIALREWATDTRVLVLPGLACLDDALCARVVAFVEAGGGALVVGETSAMDGWARRRTDFGLRRLLPDGVRLPGLSAEQHVAAAHVPVEQAKARLAPSEETYHRFGRGRVVYAPSLVDPATQPSLLNPDGTYNFALDTTNWRVPERADALRRAIAWLLDNRPTLRVDATRGVIANYYRQPDTGAYYAHIVNLTSETAHNVVVRMALPDGAQATGVHVLSPDRHAYQADWRVSGAEVVASLDDLDVYAVVVFETAT